MKTACITPGVPLPQVGKQFLKGLLLNILLKVIFETVILWTKMPKFHGQFLKSCVEKFGFVFHENRLFFCILFEILPKMLGTANNII